MNQKSAKMLQVSSNIIKYHYITKQKSCKTLNKRAQEGYVGQTTKEGNTNNQFFWNKRKSFLIN